MFYQIFLLPKVKQLVVSRIDERLKRQDLRKLGSIRKVLKLHRIVAQYFVVLQNGNLLVLAKSSLKTEIIFSRSVLFCIKTRVSLKYFVNAFNNKTHKFLLLTSLVSFQKISSMLRFLGSKYFFSSYLEVILWQITNFEKFQCFFNIASLLCISNFLRIYHMP